MLSWLVILLNSFLPVDLVALILPTDMMVAEGVPAETVVGFLEQNGDRPADFEVMAAIPDGVLDIDPKTSEIFVTDSQRLDYESTQRIVLLIRESQAKPPDLYRSLFVDQLLRNGANPRDLKRFTAETRYRLCVIEVTDVDEAQLLHTVDPVEQDEHTLAIDIRSFNIADRITIGTPQCLIPKREHGTLEITPIDQIQAYLDRLSHPESRQVASPLIDDNIDSEAVKIPQSIDASDVEAIPADVLVETIEPSPSVAFMEGTNASQAVLATPSKSEIADFPPPNQSRSDSIVENHRERIEQSAEEVPIAISEASSDLRQSRNPALWWLSNALLIFLLSCYCMVFAWKRVKHKHSVIQHNRVLDQLDSAAEKCSEPITDLDSKTGLCDLNSELDEDDIRLLQSLDNRSPSEDVAEFMESCLSALGRIGNASDPTGDSNENRQKVSNPGMTEGAVAKLDAVALEPAQADGTERSQLLVEDAPDLTSSDGLSEVERVQKIIRDEFGIEEKKPVKHERPPPIDLGNLRKISLSASRRAIETSKVNLRQRKIHRLLTQAVMTCSVGCGVAAVALSPEVHVQLLLVSVSALALLGYIKSCQSEEERD